MRTLLLLQSGSPIEARTTLNVFAVILIVALIAAAIAIFFFISRYVTTYKTSPAYLERKRAKPTTIADLNQVAKECGLEKEEKDILWAISKKNSSMNLLFFVKEIEQVEEAIRKEFFEFDNAGDELGKNSLFSLRKKLLKVYQQKIIIKTSRAIDENTTFTYTVTKGFHHKIVLKESTPDGLILELPQSLTNSPDKPAALSKIALIFEAKDGSPYEFETRVVRYQQGKNGEQQMITVHTDKLTPLQKRQAERIELRLPCKFSSVKVQNEGKKKDVIYTPSEKEYDGTLEDISVGGCRIITNLTIKAEQYIYLSGPFNGSYTDNAIGAIVRTTKRSDNVYILHIKFIKIDVAAVNRIQARVYGYSLSTE